MAGRTEFKTEDQNTSANPATLFCPSLHDIVFDKLLEDKGSMQNVFEYVMLDNKLPEDVREGMKNALRPLFVKHLCNLVVKDKKAETQAMLWLDPGLMFEENKEPVRDHVKRIIPGSAYRIAWGAKAHTMLTIMDSLIDKVSNGRQLASDQYKKQCPDTKLDSKQYSFPASETTLKPMEKKPFNFDALVAAITADEVKDREPNAKTTEELQKFREHFKHEGKVIESENHFDEESFKKVLEIGRKNFQPWNWKQYNLFCRKVIGFFLRSLPACDFLAMINKGGIVSVVDRKQSVPDGDISLKFKPYGELGFDCFIDLFGIASGMDVDGGLLFAAPADWEDYFQIKNQILGELKQRLQNPNASPSVSL